jgi:coproporphyrinogen III oxidase
MILTIFLDFKQRWEYMHEPTAESEEGILMKVLKSPVDWLNLEGQKNKK